MVLHYLSRIKKYLLLGVNSRICNNVNKSSFKRNCLLLYVVEPFIFNKISLSHQNQWQAKELARIIGEYGYNVDVISCNNVSVKLTKNYDMIVDLHPRLDPPYNGKMHPECLKIAYITGSNPSFSNAAEQERIDNLFLRRKESVSCRRYATPFEKKVLESFDAVFFIGNPFNWQTYAEFNLSRFYYINNTGVDFHETYDPGIKSPNKFLFLASGGQVHKGLDLLLEVFSKNSSMELFVCSSFKMESDFCAVYRNELYNTANIKPIGFVNITSPEFKQICAQCSFMVLPSCSEANAGSVLTAMSAGLIPIISRECGFSEDIVNYFADCRVETIDATLKFFQSKSRDWIRDESYRVREYITSHYSHKQFSLSVRNAFDELLN